MPTFIGMSNSSTVNAAQKVPSFSDALTRLMPSGTAPLYLIMSKLGDGTAKQFKHTYWTETVPFPSMTLSAAALVGDTTLNVVSTTDVVPGCVFRVQSTGEIVRVLTVASATSVTVARGVGTIAAAAIANAAKLYQVGSAFEEGSTRPQSVRLQQTAVDNYTQIFRNAWSVTGTAGAEEIYEQTGGAIPAKSLTDAAMFHARDIETALLFGQKSLSVVNGQPFHTMDGIESSVRQFAPAANINTAGATTNYSQLITFLDPVFNTVTSMQEAPTRLMFVGAKAVNVINQIGRLSGQYQIMEGQTSFGLQFTSFKIPRGKFLMIEHPIFNSNLDWSSMAMVVDTNVSRLMYLNGRKTQHKYFGVNGGISTDNSIDATGGVYTSELTFECVNPNAFGLLLGLTAGAAG